MFQEIFTHLFQNKLRTALTGLSVSVGIFLLIFLLGAGNGLIHAFENNMSMFAVDAVRIYPGQTSKPFDGLKEWRFINFDQNDIASTQRALPQHISEVTPITETGQHELANDAHSLSASLEGVYPHYVNMEKILLLAGRFINRADVRESRKTMVITQTVAEELFGEADKAVGQLVRVDSLVFRVVGVRSTRGDFGETTSYIPFTTAQTVYQKAPYVNRLLLRTVGLDTKESTERFDATMRRSFAARHRFAPDDPTAVWINKASSGSEEQGKAMSLLRIGLWTIGLLTLLSGVVSISNIMLITVKERTHEFGIRKALGARPWSILRSVLAESVIITAFFGYIGLVAGVVATEWMNRRSGEMVMEIADMKFYTFLDPTVDLHIALGALGVLIVSGLVAGFFPARKAVRVKPIEALNTK